MPSRAAHLLSLTQECISTAQLGEHRHRRNNAARRPRRVGGATTIGGTLRRLSAGTSTASKPTPIQVTTFMSLEASQA